MTVSGGVGWLREARPDGYRYISVHLDSGAIAATRWSPDSSGMQVLGSRIWSIVPTTNGTRETDAVVEYDLHDQRVVRRWTESDLTVSDHAGNPDRLVPDEVYATEREIYVLGFGFASSDLILVEVHRSSGALAWSKVVGIAADGDILEPGRQLVADARNVYVATDHDAGGGLTTTHAVTRLAPTGAVLARQTLRPDNPDHSGANLELGPSAVYVAVYHPPTRDLSVTLTSLDRSSLRKRGSVDLTGYRGDQATDEALWTFVTRYDPTCGGDRSLFGVRKHDPVTLRPVGPTMMFPAVYDISLAITTGEVWVSEHNHAEVPVRLTAYRLR